MTQPPIDKVFAGSIPKVYQSHFVPLIFEPYAADIAERLAERDVSRVLEIAAGTGVVTRALDKALPDDVAIVATDLNPGMLEEARAQGTRRTVDWRTADAMALPFPDASFDCVVCQFGVMFFPDRVHAYTEARRVLAPGGVFLFNAWDRIEENDIAHVVTESLATLFPADPPRFMARTPHGYHDVEVIRRDVAAAGFPNARIETLAKRSVAPSALDPAIAYCQGTPLRSEIEARGSLEEATRVATRAIESRFGTGPVDGMIQAHVVMVER
ncbi:MAG TPA: class I SAM-dependent methyltransferase [Usitatibacter sp.]|nr:class I SAM-dependent methyltransferase [Usitatibacter sp.]